MSWTCPKCQQTMEEPESGEIQFCLHCGAPAGEDEATVAGGPADSRQRLLMSLFGVLWLVLFFIPFGQSSYGMVMSWSLLRDAEGMSYLVSWPLMLAVVFLVLGVVGPLPAWVRSSASLILGCATLIVFGANNPGGPFGADIQFVFSGKAAWLFMFPAVGLGLLLRVQTPRSIGARVLLAIGLVFGLVAYLTGRDGETTLVGAFLRYFSEPDGAHVFARLMILLPIILLIASTVGFAFPSGSADPARPWARGLCWAFLLYLPVFLFLQGIVLAAVEESGWFFLMFFRLAVYLAGIFAALAGAVPWIFDIGRRHLLPHLQRGQ